jgi:hypothetical protein
MKVTDDACRSRDERRPYRCFLLRCRQEEGALPSAGLNWRFTVQEAGMDEARRGFVSLQELEAYLEVELGLPGAPAAGEEP